MTRLRPWQKSRRDAGLRFFRVFPFGLLLGVVLGGCCGRNSSQPKAELALRPPEPYVRVSVADSNIIQLQIAIRQFLPLRGKGPSIWLAGVSHIGETNYYNSLQRHLDAQSLVLFEGISEKVGQGKRAMSKPKAEAAAGAAAATGRSSLQSSLATSMGLVFQLEAIDYDRPNFRNSDLSVPELRDLLVSYSRPSEGSSAGERFEGVLQMMEGGSLLDSLVQFGLRLVSNSSKLQAFGRLALIDLLGDIQGDLGQLTGLPPEMKQLLEVLLERRNEKVLSDLKSELRQIGHRGSIAIFYGTGHMPDLEKRLRQELHYRPAEQMWLTAFSVNPVQAGVSDSERAFVRGLIRGQMDKFREKRRE